MTLAGIALAVSAVSLRIPALVWLVVGMGLLKMLEVNYDCQLQHHIQGNLRATVTSVGGFLAESFSYGAYLLFGAVAKIAGAAVAFGWFGGVVLLVAALNWMKIQKLFGPSFPFSIR